MGTRLSLIFIWSILSFFSLVNLWNYKKKKKNPDYHWFMASYSVLVKSSTIFDLFHYVRSILGSFISVLLFYWSKKFHSSNFGLKLFIPTWNTQVVINKIFLYKMKIRVNTCFSLYLIQLRKEINAHSK